MLPRDLKPEQFSSYPPLARKLVTDNLDTLRKLPLSFLPSLLREGRKRPCRGRAADQRNELAPSHCLPRGSRQGIVSAQISTL